VSIKSVTRVIGCKCDRDVSVRWSNCVGWDGLVGPKTFESGGRHLVRARQKSGRAEVGSKGEAEVT
jgi:hypothetical protein